MAELLGLSGWHAEAWWRLSTASGGAATPTRVAHMLESMICSMLGCYAFLVIVYNYLGASAAGSAHNGVVPLRAVVAGSPVTWPGCNKASIKARLGSTHCWSAGGAPQGLVLVNYGLVELVTIAWQLMANGERGHKAERAQEHERGAVVVGHLA